MRCRRLLILGGTTEGAELARALAGDVRVEAVLSLAGVTRAPAASPLPVRVGGFGGAEGLAAFLREGGFDGMVDATHPYAVGISRNAVIAAELAGVAFVRVARPAWVAGPGDRWVEVGSLEEAARLGAVSRRVLLTVGRKELGAFAAAPWHRYVVRSVDAPGGGVLPGAVVVVARGPFALEGELALLREHGVEVMVTKNSGGGATAAKLVAARMLGVEVVMLARPAEAGGASVADVAGVLAWLG
ncbi:MAG: cobalt-precorrin-6A reductase [Janthinobacterium lividum]